MNKAVVTKTFGSDNKIYPTDFIIILPDESIYNDFASMITSVPKGICYRDIYVTYIVNSTKLEYLLPKHSRGDNNEYAKKDIETIIEEVAAEKKKKEDEAKAAAEKKKKEEAEAEKAKRQKQKEEEAAAKAKDDESKLSQEEKNKYIKDEFNTYITKIDKLLKDSQYESINTESPLLDIDSTDELQIKPNLDLIINTTDIVDYDADKFLTNLRDNLSSKNYKTLGGNESLIGICARIIDKFIEDNKNTPEKIKKNIYPYFYLMYKMNLITMYYQISNNSDIRNFIYGICYIYLNKTTNMNYYIFGEVHESIYIDIPAY